MNKISKYIALSTFAVSSLALVGCGKSNTNQELAKKIETESTELIYSIESMDSIRMSDLDDETIAANATYTISSYTVLTENLSPSQKRMQGANPKKYQNKTSDNQSESTQKTNNNDIASTTSSKSSSNNTVATTSESKTKSETKKQSILKLTTNDFGDADEYSKQLVEKRSEVMLLCSKLRKGDIKLSKDELSRVNECIELVNNTAEYLESSKGKIEKEYKSAKTTAEKVALREKLAIRQAKLQTGILAMDEIIGIMDKTNSQAKEKTTKTTQNSSTTAQKTTINKEKSTAQSTTKTTNKNQSETKNNQTTSQTTTQTAKQTTNQDNDAVSILVQPVKTQSSQQNTTNQTTKTKQSSEYIVQRPRNVSKIYNNMPVFSATAMPEPLPKTSTVPYHSAQNVGYSA